MVVASFIVFALLDFMLRNTRIGKAMRAIAQNQETAKIIGINVGMIASITLVLSVLLGGLAGVLVAPAFYILPTMGVALLIKCFAAVVMGGQGNVQGAFIASYALGIIESFGIFYIGNTFHDLFAFLLLLSVLLAKPEGSSVKVNLI
jgi:branched-chain amino acid transport system permease protein